MKLPNNTRSQILGWFIGLISVAIATSAIVTQTLLTRQLYEQVDRALNQEVEELSRLVQGRNPETGIAFRDEKDLEALFSVFISRSVPEEDEYFLALIDGDLYTASPQGFPDSIRELLTQLPQVLPNHARVDQPGRYRDTYLTTQDEELIYLAYALPIAVNRQGLFVVVHTLQGRQNYIRRVVRLNIQVISAFSLVALGLGWVTTGRVLTPLKQLTLTAQSIESANHALDKRIPVRGTEEVARLSQTFNAMLERLQGSFASQQAFLDDASHELQTPITIIQGHLNLLAQSSPDPAAIDPAAVLPIIEDEINRMSRLVRELSMLARAERPDFLLLDLVQVNRLLQDIHAKATTLAPRNWVLGQAPAVQLVADRDRLTQMIMNLLQNAVAHTAPHDTIELGAQLMADQVHLWVRDTGVGISPADQQRVFQRFSRVAQRRPERAGLGLAIVQAIAQAHGGQVLLKSQLGQGATFTVVMPLEPPQDLPQ